MKHDLLAVAVWSLAAALAALFVGALFGSVVNDATRVIAP